MFWGEYTFLGNKFGDSKDFSYLCEKIRYEKFRLWKIPLNSGHW